MALYFTTNTPSKLLADFKKAIDEGHVKTWSYDAEGDFTHAKTQWENVAWLKPNTDTAGRLTFFIIPPKTQKISKAVYGIYHGRFIESMLTHFNNSFSQGLATSMPVAGDTITGSQYKP
jgi:hypothetical protein